MLRFLLAALAALFVAAPAQAALVRIDVTLFHFTGPVEGRIWYTFDTDVSTTVAYNPPFGVVTGHPISGLNIDWTEVCEPDCGLHLLPGSFGPFLRTGDLEGSLILFLSNRNGPNSIGDVFSSWTSSARYSETRSLVETPLPAAGLLFAFGLAMMRARRRA